MRNRIIALGATLTVLLLVIIGYNLLIKDDTVVNKAVTQNDSSTSQTVNNTASESSSTNSENSTTQNNNSSSENKDNTTSTGNKTPETVTQPTYINGIMIANKKNPLPKNFNPGEDATARANINKLISDAQNQGLNISNQTSGFRSYDTQASLYNNYVAAHGQQQADTFSARPGYSEHQTGLAYDLIDNQGQLLGAAGTINTSKEAAVWVAQNAHKYGFIVRYKEEFVNQTGYMAEPWHLRYVGNEIALEIYNKNISLEQYLGASGGDYNN